MAEKLLHTDITAATFRDDAVSAELPERARIVVVGGGVVGTSIALHLAEAGERDVVLLERHRIASGTSWHAAGLVVRARGTHALTTISDRSVGIYAGLEERTGVEVGFNRCGSLTLATTPGRWDELRYHQQVQDNGYMQLVPSTAPWGDVWTGGPPYRFSKTPERWFTTPQIGEHNDEILRELAEGRGSSTPVATPSNTGREA